MADPVTIGIELALFAAEMALTASQKIKGPRLDDLNVTLADYGSPIPRLWGKRRLNPQIIWAEKLHEVKVESKTKGGKYTQYKYYGTWAVLICDHEIDAVARIWFDKRLVYDRTKRGPIAIAALLGGGDTGQIKLAENVNMRVHLGTETQDPDRRIEAWCEDRYGPNSCPAYKGSAYIVFQAIPLEQAGNRIPQVALEAINNKTDIYPHEFTVASSTFIGTQFSGTRLYSVSSSDLMVWDLPTQTEIVYAQLDHGADTNSAYAVTDAGIYAVAGAGSRINFIGLDGGSYNVGATFLDGIVGWDGIYNVGGRLLLTPGAFAGNRIGGMVGTEVVYNDVNFSASFFFLDTLGNIVCLGGTGLDELAISVGVGDATLIDTSLYGTSGSAYGFDNGTNYVVRQGHYLFLIDRTLLTIVSAVDTGFTLSRPITHFSAIAAGSPVFWNGLTKYDSTDLSVIQTVTLATWSGSGRVAELTGTIYDPVTNALLSFDSGVDPGIIWRYLDRISSSGVTLQTVVDDVSGWCGLTGQDTSALTQTVLGYSVTQGPGKDMIVPLLDIHDVDARPHDFSVQFVNRGSAPSGTILTPDFVRSGDNRYKVTIQQDTDLPRDVTFNFADWDKDQQPNNVKTARPVAATSSSRSDTIDLTTYADTTDAAQQKADRYQRRLWNSRERTVLSLTAQKLGLEPGDVTTVSLDGAVRNVRLDKMTIAGQQIDCEFIRDETSFAALNPATTGPTMDGRDDETIFIPAPTKGFELDIPLTNDADNDVNPVIYVAAGGYTDPWPGAFVFRGDDGSYDDQFFVVDTSSEATWGYTTDALDTANPNLWDRGNTFNVTMKNGTLATVTEAQIDADTTLNLAALGNVLNGYELLQFTTATLEIDGSYTLSGLKRGRRGTEGYISGHTVGEEFLLVDNATAVELGTDTIGDAISFKSTSAGRSIDDAPPISMTYSGASLKPYAPARIKWTTDGTDMFAEIDRRTRVGGSWNGGSTIPLSENSEAYEVDIYHLTTFKRTVTVTGTNVFTYTAAQIAADGNTVGVDPPCNVYQMSDTVGRGFALAA